MTFGQHPIQDLNNIHEVNTQQMAQRIEQLFSELRAEMKRGQAIQSKQANKSRRVGTLLGIGENVWLHARNISTTQPSKLLDWKRIGPYEHTDVISPWANRIQLPNQRYMYDVQLISCLEKATLDPVSYQQQGPPPPVIVDREEEYKVEQIDDSRLLRWQLQYLAKWRRYDKCSWEPVTNVNILKAVYNFHSEQQGKPRL
jgi:hypothetical protein